MSGFRVELWPAPDNYLCPHCHQANGAWHQKVSGVKLLEEPCIRVGNWFVWDDNLMMRASLPTWVKAG